MSFKFGTPAWADALREEINGSSEYRNAAAGWGDGFDGSMLFVFEADAALDRTVQLMLRLADGACQYAEFVGEGQAPATGFTLAAPFTLWREILERKSMAATAIMTGRMKVEGPKMTLLKNTAASRALIHCTASVETDWS